MIFINDKNVIQWWPVHYHTHLRSKLLLFF